MLNEHLDFSEAEYKALLDKSTEMVLRQFQTVQNQKGYHDHPQAEVEQWFNEELPEQSMDVPTLLDEVEKKVLHTATGNLGPNMYAYVMSGGNQIAIIAEKLAHTINQNQTKWHLAPAMNEIEKRVIR
ncbi:MAG: pyridoxal-dependent decarboxylase, partial [Bacteroidota bacterium]